MRVKWISLLGGLSASVVLLASSVTAQPAGSYKPESAVSAAAAVVRPSVVAIETRFDSPTLNDDYTYWQFLRGARPLYGLWGTGFIYKDPQYVITAEFLMEHQAFVRVILDDGRSYEATLVGKNDDFKVAVLKVDWGPDLEPISPPFGNSDELKLGQPIAIVGKSLNSVDTYATAGIISAIRKETPGSVEPTDEFLQFDASYEMSFIGGPMIDINGSVIGMVRNTLEGANLNLGVPVNDIVTCADQIIAGEVIETWFGAEPLLMTGGVQASGLAPREFDWNRDGKPEKVEFGMWVSYVEPNSPADIAGLKVGDTIVELDDHFIKYQYDWTSYVRTFKVGQLVTVKFIRKNAAGEWERLETQAQIVAKPGAEEKKSEESTSSLPPGHPPIY
jgi:S1-C subfamily serine protease